MNYNNRVPDGRDQDWEWVPGKISAIEYLTMIIGTGFLLYFFFEIVLFDRTIEMPEIILISSGIFCGIAVVYGMGTIFWGIIGKIKDPQRRESFSSFRQIKSYLYILLLFAIIFFILADNRFDNFRSLLFLFSFSLVISISNMRVMYRNWVRKGRYVGPDPITVMSHQVRKNLSSDRIKNNIREGLKTKEQRAKENAVFVWDCPNCRKRNYEDAHKIEVRCRRCGRVYTFGGQNIRNDNRRRRRDDGMPPMSKGWWGNFDEYEWK